MKALVFGAAGQLGTALRADCPLKDVAFLDRSQVDLGDAAAVSTAISAVAPAVVINAAAYTAVDRAESERDTAYAINEAAPAASSPTATTDPTSPTDLL